MSECLTCRAEQTPTRLHIPEELVKLEGELGGGEGGRKEEVREEGVGRREEGGGGRRGAAAASFTHTAPRL